MIAIREIGKIIAARKKLHPGEIDWQATREQAAEGGCGVIGIACSEQIAGRHLLQALDQMRNRGNGKGGGIAAVGLVPEEFGVSREVLDNDYLLAVAYLDPGCRGEVEAKYIEPLFEIDHVREAPQLDDFRKLPSLEIKPPEVVLYFVRVKEAAVEAFRKEHGLDLARSAVEDEIVYQNTFRLNSEFYASKSGLSSETRAFVLSHGKNLLVLKMVGYGEDVVRYYKLEDMHAHVWIGHHRYPTKGRVWHPGGAHPFIGMNEALVHNGDFANYASIGEYLAQRNIYPLFLTDTEVSVQVFDLLYRTYDYPLEYVIEALAPTTERDFAMLPPDKQRIYNMLQVTHMHSSPDGPWFFLIAQSDRKSGSPVFRLTGITDTSMLRPQVFALQESGPVGEDGKPGPAIGFAASEKQGIDAALASLAAEDKRFWGRADRYWNARGGSHTDGGAFIFSVSPDEDGAMRLVSTDKFNRRIEVGTSKKPFLPGGNGVPTEATALALPELEGERLFEWVKRRLPNWDYAEVQSFLGALEAGIDADSGRRTAFDVLTRLIDRHYPSGALRRSSLLALFDRSLAKLVKAIAKAPSAGYAYSSFKKLHRAAALPEQVVVVDAAGFPPEGLDSAALELVRLYRLGFKHMAVVNTAGHRFLGNGFGAGTQGVRIDVYGSPGDYLGSGLDGIELFCHANGQDQMAQIMKSGKLVVYGDAGQTFGYAAKGGEVYVLGNLAGRPMINAVGKPRVVINGTCLDYLAESFMAGDPHNGGGFVILNGLRIGEEGEVIELETPYPGGNLFSLASGGAIFVRDPHHRLSADQLNGGEFFPFNRKDWQLILPHLEENARLFDLPVERLLEVDGRQLAPEQVYRKIGPAAVRALQAEEAWVAKH